jgi:hypothetical protein
MTASGAYERRQHVAINCHEGSPEGARNSYSNSNDIPHAGMKSCNHLQASLVERTHLTCWYSALIWYLDIAVEATLIYSMLAFSLDLADSVDDRIEC